MSKVILTRREIFDAMMTFEEEVDVESDQLEDITSILFDTVQMLEGT